MKLLSVLAILSIASCAVALPAIGAHHDASGELIMALDDEGYLFELTRDGWVPIGDPCPGEGPYSIELVRMESVEDSVFVLAFDGEGHLFQSDGSGWIELIHPIEGALPPCLSLLLHATESDLSVMLVDADGTVSFGTAGGEWQSLSEMIPSIPVRDIDFQYDDRTQTLYPFVLGEDGNMYGYVDEGWHSSEFTGFDAGLTRFEIEVDRETGLVLMVAIDGSGRIYDNLASGELALTDHDPCPGEGPWDLRLSYITGSAFDLLCIDSSGCLHVADRGNWERATGPFPAEER